MPSFCYPQSERGTSRQRATYDQDLLKLRAWGSGGGQREGERCALPRPRRIRPHAATHRLDKRLGDRQTDARTAQRSAARLVDAVEALEHARQVFRRNADTAVQHTELDSAADRTHREVHVARCWRIAQRVAEHVAEDLDGAIGVGPYVGHTGRNVRAERQPLIGKRGAESIDRGSDQFRWIAFLECEWNLPRLGAG